MCFRSLCVFWGFPGVFQVLGVVCAVHQPITSFIRSWKLVHFWPPAITAVWVMLPFLLSVPYYRLASLRQPRLPPSSTPEHPPSLPPSATIAYSTYSSNFYISPVLFSAESQKQLCFQVSNECALFSCDYYIGSFHVMQPNTGSQVLWVFRFNACLHGVVKQNHKRTSAVWLNITTAWWDEWKRSYWKWISHLFSIIRGLKMRWT